MDSRVATYEHIHQVQTIMGRVVEDLQRRQLNHDRSKLVSPEVEIFDEFTEKLRGSTYGSDEYKGFLAAMKPGLDHHYAANDHHPEHHPIPADPMLERVQAARDEIEFKHIGPWSTDAVTVLDENIASRKSRVRSMSLLDLLEMLCDWKAATMRHADGDIRRSVEINQKRFGYSDELKRILLNTLGVIESQGEKEAPK